MSTRYENQTTITEAVLLSANATSEPNRYAGPQAELTAGIRVTNDSGREARYKASDYRFSILGEGDVEIAALEPAEPSEVVVPPGAAGELTVPFRLEHADFEPDRVYHFYWEGHGETGKTPFKFL